MLSGHSIEFTWLDVREETWNSEGQTLKSRFVKIRKFGRGRVRDYLCTDWAGGAWPSFAKVCLLHYKTSMANFAKQAEGGFLFRIRNIGSKLQSRPSQALVYISKVKNSSWLVDGAKTLHFLWPQKSLIGRYRGKAEFRCALHVIPFCGVHLASAHKLTNLLWKGFDLWSVHWWYQRPANTIIMTSADKPSRRYRRLCISDGQTALVCNDYRSRRTSSESGWNLVWSAWFDAATTVLRMCSHCVNNHTAFWLFGSQEWILSYFVLIWEYLYIITWATFLRPARRPYPCAIYTNQFINPFCAAELVPQPFRKDGRGMCPTAVSSPECVFTVTRSIMEQAPLFKRIYTQTTHPIAGVRNHSSANLLS